MGKDDICSGIQVELGKYEKVVKEFKEMEQTFRQQEARENSGKRGQKDKARLEITNYPNL